MRAPLVLGLLLGTSTLAGATFWAVTVPTDVQMPGTQPNEVSGLESPDKCDNCHGGYDLEVEPAHNWRGSMMSHASRDPLFWATVAIAEQDFDGSGDLCLRCHFPDGWLAGRSTPTDGSGMHDSDSQGVTCDLCHSLVDPDDSEHLGNQFAPFLAHDEGSTPEGYYGNGMFVLWGGGDKLGPYDDADANHQFMSSDFHRSVEFCNTCHDVSNPVVGDLAHNNGAQIPPPGATSGVPGDPVDGKAAFNNFPYSYGVVERTSSEYMSGLLSRTPVSDYLELPEELQAGAIRRAYEAALATGAGGDYADQTERVFSCQTCHMPPVTGYGCDKNGVPLRYDLPLHDMTGGNTWVPDAIAWMNAQGTLRAGGNMSQAELDGLAAGKLRARENLTMAASLEVEGDTVRVVNLTGHKLISGYPEGRRMWLHVSWYDGSTTPQLLREDGAYGPITVDLDGSPTQVETLLDLHDPNARVWEAHYGMDQEWAQQLVDLGVSTGLVLDYDRVTGAPGATLGELAAMTAGSVHETFHFVLNNRVISDNRIPTWGMAYDEARVRNALPVPEDQYGDPGAGGAYLHWDDVALDPPAGAASAAIELLYQTTSWEYVQFLALANLGQIPFLADLGENLLDAWLATGMAQPEVMASTTWPAGPEPADGLLRGATSDDVRGLRSGP